MSLQDYSVGRIEQIHLHVVKLPLVGSFETSFAVQHEKEALLIQIESEGTTAWGECVADPDPFYAYETIPAAQHIIKDFLLPLVEDGVTLGEVDRRFRHVRGHEMAKATVENALIDLVAKRQGVPLFVLLGGEKKKIRSGISIGIKANPGQLLDAVEGAVHKKYHRVKMKIKKGKDSAYVRAVRDRFPNLLLMADANADYQLTDAPLLKALDPLQLMMIEQPLSHSDIYQHSLLQRQLSTPICLDESIETLEDAKAAIELGSCRIINIKQGRVGGLMESMRIAEYAKHHGIPVWSGGMLETGIGRAVNIHLQTVDGFTLPGDTSETSRYFDEDIVEPPVVLDPDGFIDIPEGSGIGVRVIPKRLHETAAYHERVR